MIKISGLSKSYNGKKVVDNLSFTMKEGNLFALLGSNGAGKSTTIKMILSLVKKDEGTIEIPGDVTVGYSPETPYFPPFLTGAEVLLYYGALQKIPKDNLKGECEELLHLVGLSEEKTKIKFYSKGMLQRLALAQAMLGNPSILILDEPCAGLGSHRISPMLPLYRLAQPDARMLPAAVGQGEGASRRGQQPVPP